MVQVVNEIQVVRVAWVVRLVQVVQVVRGFQQGSAPTVLFIVDKINPF